MSQGRQGSEGSQNQEQQDNKKYVTPTLSKKRYLTISEKVQELLEDKDKTDKVLEIICQVTKFDPCNPRYTPEIGQREMAYKKKKAEELGISLYELLKQKKYRQKKREKEKSI
jgi:hypothetical protein